jgi:hypothetical protein
VKVRLHGDWGSMMRWCRGQLLLDVVGMDRVSSFCLIVEDIVSICERTAILAT